MGMKHTSNLTSDLIKVSRPWLSMVNLNSRTWVKDVQMLLLTTWMHVDIEIYLYTYMYINIHTENWVGELPTDQNTKIYIESKKKHVTWHSVFQEDLKP